MKAPLIPEAGWPAPAIGDYGLIGDCRTAALVSRWGSIDWLCLPDFGSPSVFAAILDPAKGGRFQIVPSGEFESSRRYLGDSAVLQTTFVTRSGSARLTDLLVLGDASSLDPGREVLRIVEGIEGSVRFHVLFQPRPDYGRAHAPVRQKGRGAFTCSHGNELLLLRCPVPLASTSDRRGAVGEFEIGAGERACFSLAFSHRDLAVIMPTGDAAMERVERTLAWWSNWAATCSWDGPHREAVLRSAITLKLLTFAPSGAVVAAATTSLPEAIGGGRNWDYRYCWLRDAALTMRAFLAVGLKHEADAFLKWLLHATALTQPRLGVMYDVYGRTSLEEKELAHLSGYRASVPVRIGNGAYRQIQLDVYGGVVSAAAEYVADGGTLGPQQLNLLAGFGRIVCAEWRRVDHGIWEMRGEKRQYTFSKLMCWVALDRLIYLADRTALPIDRESVAREREAIHDAIEGQAWNPKLGAYAGELGGDWLDASLLAMSCLGYVGPDNPRMRSTLDAVWQHLGRDALIYRYEPCSDGLPSREGAFGICSFWVIDNLAIRGETAQAEQLFAKLLACANDLGLYGEEIEPGTGATLGNFPQAFTHVGLINAAVALGLSKRIASR